METRSDSEIQAELALGYAAAGITNFNTGGVANTFIETQGGVAAALYDYGLECVPNGIPKTAADAFLDALVWDRSLTRLAAEKTLGTIYMGVNVAKAVNVPIPAGKIVGTNVDANGVRYNFVVASSETLLAGALEIAVSVEAQEAGAAYNVPVDSITKFVTPIPGIDWVENRTDWISSEGADEETDARLALRYKLAFDELSTGSTTSAYLKWCLDDIRVAIAFVDNNFPRGEGTINIYLIGTGGAPSAGLIADVQAYVDARRPAGDDVLVLGFAEKTVDIEITLYRYEGYDPDTLETTVLAMLTAYFNPSGSSVYDWIRPVGVGRKVVYSQLMEICQREDAVYDVVFDDPTADIAVALNELPVLGTVTIHHEEVAV